MFTKKFDTSYVGFTQDGAKWLVENTNIKLVGKMNTFFLSDWSYLARGIFLFH